MCVFVCVYICVCKQDARGEADIDSWAAAECVTYESSGLRLLTKDIKIKQNTTAYTHANTHRCTDKHSHAHIAEHDFTYYLYMRLFRIPDTRFNSKIFIFFMQSRQSSLRCAAMALVSRRRQILLCRRQWQRRRSQRQRHTRWSFYCWSAEDRCGQSISLHSYKYTQTRHVCVCIHYII